MRNLFTRRESPILDRSDAPRVAGMPTSPIADIQLLGETVVATITLAVISSDEGVDALAQLLVDLEETSAANLVLDIQNIEYMDSACLGCLVESLNRLARRGGRITLVNPAHRVYHLFRLTRLDRVFNIVPDVLAAIDLIEGREEE